MTGREKHEHVVLFLYIRGKRTPRQLKWQSREGTEAQRGVEGELCLPRGAMARGVHAGCALALPPSANGVRQAMLGKGTQDAQLGVPTVLIQVGNPYPGQRGCE